MCLITSYNQILREDHGLDCDHSHFLAKFLWFLRDGEAEETRMENPSNVGKGLK